MSYGAKLQLCFLSSNFWDAPCFPLMGVEVLFLVLRVGRSFNASGLLGFVSCNYFHKRSFGVLNFNFKFDLSD
jgi:hypothetical protein